MRLRPFRHITALAACYMFCMSAFAVPIRRLPGLNLPEYRMHTDRDNPALWSSQPAYVTNRAPLPGAYAVSDIPRTGTIEYPLVLVEFQDTRFIIKDKDSLRAHYERVFNGHDCSDTVQFSYKGYSLYGAHGSVSDYFRDQSYGKYTPTFKIIGPITLSKGYAYYGQGRDGNAAAMVRELCDSIITNNPAELSGFAPNGRLDQISIIYAGRGENYTGSDPNTIWPHADHIYFSRYDSLIYSSGLRYAKYACSAELYWDSDSIMDGIGTFCHEFSHTLGLPDFYDTEADDYDLDNAAMGFWSLMDYGCYEDEGFSPVGYTAFEKFSLGWLDLEEITYTGVHTIDDISRNPDPKSGIHTAYSLSAGSDDQFVLLECHYRNGWYRFQGSEGLMVTVVDYDRSLWYDNEPNVGSLKHYRILPADNNYGMYTNNGDLFPQTDSLGNVIDSITTTGKPELKVGSAYPRFSIYDITKNTDRVTFRVGYDLSTDVKLRKQQDVSVDIVDGALSVSAPAGSIVTVYDMTGKPVQETSLTSPTQRIPLPGRGIWIVKCGNITRKVRL